MGFLDKFLKSSDGDSILEIERKLVDLDKEEAAARQAISRIDTLHDANLLAEDDKQLDADAAARTKAERLIARCGIARTDLQQKLVVAREKIRAAMIIELKREEAALSDRLRGAMKEAIATNEAVHAISEKAAAMFGHASATLFPSRRFPIISQQVFDTWAMYLDTLDGPLASRALTPGALSVRPPQALKREIMPPTPSPKAKRKARAALPETVPAGHWRIAFIRPGFEAPDGDIMQIGDRLDLPVEAARPIVQSGAADIVDSSNSK